MHGVGADPELGQSAVGFLRVQDVRGLGRAVGGELVVFPVLPVRIVEVDVSRWPLMAIASGPGPVLTVVSTALVFPSTTAMELLL